MNKRSNRLHSQEIYKKASLTLEASLVMPLFVFTMIFFIYFIQIIFVQEKIQAGITRMGLDLAKAAYIYGDFLDAEEAEKFDDSIFENESVIGLHELARSAQNAVLLKLYAQNYIDRNQIRQFCIQDGYDGISFSYSKVMDEEDCIDIIIKYQMEIPIQFFWVGSMQMIQRVRLRGWTGYHVDPAYSTVENKNEKTVFITESGNVYHTDRGCSHIRLSVRSVLGVPTALRNDNGAKYYPCEYCCDGGVESKLNMYYITSDGTRYHTLRDCPKLKRTVKEVPLSQVSGRQKCKRCGQ